MDAISDDIDWYLGVIEDVKSDGMVMISYLKNKDTDGKLLEFPFW